MPYLRTRARAHPLQQYIRFVRGASGLGEVMGPFNPLLGAMPPELVCAEDVKPCDNGSYAIRRPEFGCEFAPCAPPPDRDWVPPVRAGESNEPPTPLPALIVDPAKLEIGKVPKPVTPAASFNLSGWLVPAALAAGALLLPGKLKLAAGAAAAYWAYCNVAAAPNCTVCRPLFRVTGGSDWNGHCSGGPS